MGVQRGSARRSEFERQSQAEGLRERLWLGVRTDGSEVTGVCAGDVDSNSVVARDRAAWPADPASRCVRREKRTAGALPAFAEGSQNPLTFRRAPVVVLPASDGVGIAAPRI